MTEKDKVCEMMRGRRMCSVCDIARATGLDTEVVKPLMVELATECIMYTGRLRKDWYSSAEISLIARMYADGKPYKEIAKAIGHGISGVCHKIRAMQSDGILPRRNRKREDTNDD